MKAIAVILLSLVSLSAEASYVRFWRGVQRPDLTPEQVQSLLNQKLLPETGKLAQTQARLRSYQPVLVPRSEAVRGKLPIETALVEYENEAGYRAYRSTPEGQAYGDLHWELFDKASSGSLVPERYLGIVEFERAYDLFGYRVDWMQGYSAFRIYQRNDGFTDTEFLASIESHIEHVLVHRPRAVILLVAQEYVMEYSLWESAEHFARTDLDDLAEITSRTTMSVALQKGRSVSFGQGVRYAY